MAKTCFIILSITFVSFLIPVFSYKIPYPDFTIRDTGFTVTIPEKPGVNIKWFKFSGNVNNDNPWNFIWDTNVTSTTLGEWTYENYDSVLNPGDKIYFDLQVDTNDGNKTTLYKTDVTEYRIHAECLRDTNCPMYEECFLYKCVPTSNPSRTTTEPTSTTESCLPTPTTVDRGIRAPCANLLIFTDDFDELDSWVWKPEIRFAEKPDYEFVVYMDDPRIIFIQNGVLKIKPWLLSQFYNNPNIINQKLDLGIYCTGAKSTRECSRKAFSFSVLPPIASGRITTRHNFSFKYGKVVIRAKLPTGDWIYPELFLSPEESKYGPYYDSGQMRVASLSQLEPNGTKNLHAGVLLSSLQEARTYFTKTYEGNKSWTDDFHIFVFDWKPTSITINIDGKDFFTIHQPVKGFRSLGNLLGTKNVADLWKQGGDWAPFNEEFYLDIGVGVGGEQFSESTTKPWKFTDPKCTLHFWEHRYHWFPSWDTNSVLQVDYIRVYSSEL